MGRERVCLANSRNELISASSAGRNITSRESRKANPCAMLFTSSEVKPKWIQGNKSLRDVSSNLYTKKYSMALTSCRVSRSKERMVSASVVEKLAFMEFN